jgi:hypothetical protein
VSGVQVPAPPPLKNKSLVDILPGFLCIQSKFRC